MHSPYYKLTVARVIIYAIKALRFTVLTFGCLMALAVSGGGSVVISCHEDHLCGWFLSISLTIVKKDS